jgi:hypothetical protein
MNQLTAIPASAVLELKSFKHQASDLFGELEPEASQLHTSAPGTQHSPVPGPGSLIPLKLRGAASSAALDLDESEPSPWGMGQGVTAVSRPTADVDVDSFIQAHLELFRTGVPPDSAGPRAALGSAVLTQPAGGAEKVGPACAMFPLYAEPCL